MFLVYIDYLSIYLISIYIESKRVERTHRVNSSRDQYRDHTRNTRNKELEKC
jgi:hypothetical protein